MELFDFKGNFIPNVFEALFLKVQAKCIENFPLVELLAGSSGVFEFDCDFIFEEIVGDSRRVDNFELSDCDSDFHQTVSGIQVDHKPSEGKKIFGGNEIVQLGDDLVLEELGYLVAYFLMCILFLFYLLLEVHTNPLSILVERVKQVCKKKKLLQYELELN